MNFQKPGPSVPHDSSRAQVSGTAEFVDDRPFLKNELHVGVCFSDKAKGRIENIDIEKALAVAGVAGIFSHKDLAHNQWGSIFQDQCFLAEKEVSFVGEPILVVAAESREALLEAKKLVKIEITEEKAVLDIPTAISMRSFIGPERKISCGNVEKALEDSDHTLKGYIDIAGQDHFYLESQASIAYPKEDGQIELHSSSQHPTEVQHLVAEALGLKFHQVVCVVKRMGGGFGGKESQAAPFAVFAALVAQKLNRPARLILSKDDDMLMTGKRNPFKNFYEVGFSSQGKILALRAQLFSDGGAYADLSTAIMERAMLHLDNAYYIPNLEVTGQVCKTNTAPNTAFRGFGGPKGVVTIENIIEDIAQKLKKDSLEIRKLNVYKNGQATHYGQKIDDDVLPELFEKLSLDSNYIARRKQISEHNRKTREKSLGQLGNDDGDTKTYRGLSMTAVKFGISFTTRFLNQGSALVNIHLDGTIQLSTGATEMGQGVNTKTAQVVADCFSIPNNDVKVMPTSTEKIPNTSATAASSGSDINGQAALDACLVLKEKLSKVALEVMARPKEWRGRKTAGAGTAPELDIGSVQRWQVIKFENGYVYNQTAPDEKLKFSDLVEEAYLNRISLSQQGFFKYPDIHFNKETGQGNPFFYYTNGVAVSEVSIDKFTGEMKVLRSDILMDLGRPINIGIDKGQVTGAFVQGLGWVSTENLHYENGRLVSISPSTYKIPSVHDIPRVFNCELLDNSRNMRNLKGSKAVGEPPLLLGISVWTAIKNALYESQFQGRGSGLGSNVDTISVDDTISALSDLSEEEYRETFSSSDAFHPIDLKLPATQEEIFRNLVGFKSAKNSIYKSESTHA